MYYINFVIKSKNGDHGWQHSQARLLTPWLAAGRRIKNSLTCFPYRNAAGMNRSYWKNENPTLSVHLWPKNLVYNIIVLDMNSPELFTNSDKLYKKKTGFLLYITLFYGKHWCLDLDKKCLHTFLWIFSVIFSR